MPHDHAHGHHAGHAHSHDEGLGDRALLWAVVINLGLTAVQIIGGLAADSTALVADGVHNLSDALALVLAFGARRLAARKPSPAMSFGWGRAEIVAAFVNYLALIAVSIWLMIEALVRLADPPEVVGGLVMALAGLALVVDIGTALLTARLAKESVNIRAAWLHNLADAGVSVAVLVGGALILVFGWRIADPILTILISVVILWHIRGDLGPILRMLMLGAPAHVDDSALRDAIRAVPGVEDLHHLHLWQIDERRMSAEMHLVVAEGADPHATRLAVKSVLRDYGIGHSTIETESPLSGCADDLSGQGRTHH
ncbi:MULTISPECIES: cation diffusion facilitator family transporter [unclassified Paracoccus (in: a-proteobacteria)]|uniref:cation diffusion facilitator family transporter n=1 Tax=unclassified Paracoccus (in: a-proteobacteria) TaxID=2688777 RepID=UPI0015FFAFAE|nr:MULTISPECIES: cation diffusion facilitator family transporter [unclassified Paracoccus (in: a-proteobacteria)]MBB1490050.1 cation transporter [Paracoccus sp. MC1854]MBB1496638.1 cation transporter [Paracoccus sp. MC1862]QQO43654.1 cation transporter [Paracoccus sp. MC1862]